MTVTHASAIHDRQADWFEVEPGLRFKVLASGEQTNGTYACLESIALKGLGSPLHIHHREDEYFLILEGTVHVVFGDRTLDLRAGETIMMPRGIPHAWVNRSDMPLHKLVVFTPAGFEQLCIAMATPGLVDPSRLRERYGLETIGPKP